MASDPILFDSEEFDLQDKENRTNNDNQTSVLDSKETVNEETEGNIEKETVNPIQEDSSNIQNKDVSSITQSSQDILDSICSKFQKKIESKEDPPTSRSKVSDTLKAFSSESDHIAEKFIDEIPNSLLDTGSTNEIPSNSSEIFDTPQATLLTSTNVIPNTLNSEIPDSLLETESAKEANAESMELSGQLDDSELLEEPESVDLAVDTPNIENSESDASKRPSLVSVKHCSLPLSRVKLIMKTDPNVKVVSAEATILAAIAAEKFLKFVIEETWRVTKSKKKRTMMKQHFDEAIQGLEVTEFLEGMMDDDL